MTMGQKIKMLRESAKLSQADFGELIGVSDKAVSTWENDIKIPRMGKIQAIADYFGVPKSFIIDDEKNQPTGTEASGLDGEIADLVRQLTPGQRKQALDFLRFLKESPGK